MLAKLKSLWTFVKADLLDTWQRSKMLILAVLGAVLYLEWQNLKSALLVYMGQKEITKDKKEDQTLATQENTDNNQANTLLQQAQQLPNQQPLVGSDWYKDEK
jgi:hypothetical protein